MFSSVSTNYTFNHICSTGNENIFFLVGTSNGTNSIIAKTSNGGTAWTTTEVSGFGILRGGSFLNPGEGWVVGDFGKIYQTTTEGNSWSEVASGTTATLDAIYMMDANHGVAVGADGTVLSYY